MTRLDVKGEEALDVFADMLEPLFTILSNEDVRKAYMEKNIMTAVKVAIKNCKKDVIALLAVIDGEDPETYKPGVFTIPNRLLAIFNNPDFRNLFILQAQTKDTDSSGSATENTEEADA